MKTKQVIEGVVICLFVGLDIWIVLTLADTFLGTFLITAPFLFVCYVMHEALKLCLRR